MTYTKPKQRTEDTVALLARTAAGANVQLPPTALVHLLCLLDRRAMDRYGRAVSGVDWEGDNLDLHAPAVEEVYDALLRAETPDAGLGDGGFHQEPPADLRRLAAAVIREYARKPADETDTALFLAGAARREDQRQEQGVDRLMAPARIPEHGRIAAAVAHYAGIARRTAGADEGDVAAVMRRDLAELAPSRRAATQRLLEE